MYEKTLPTLEEAVKYAEECLEEAKPKPNVRVARNSPAPAKSKTKAKPKREGKRKTLADNDNTSGQHRWSVHYCLMGTITVFADSEEEAEEIVANGSPDHWEKLLSFDNLHNVMVDNVEAADEDDIPEPVKSAKSKPEPIAAYR